MAQVMWSMLVAAMLQLTQTLSCEFHCLQISSPSGKALFQWVANETTQVDFYICALSFGKNDLGERQRIGATVSIYLNGTFVWCAPSSAVLRACTCRRCRPPRAVWLATAGLPLSVQASWQPALMF